MSNKKKTLRDAGMRYYVGDPCYVIDDARWPTFCELLEEKGYDDVYIPWATKDGAKDKVFVVSSPGGDATWNFDMTDDMGQKVSLGVDAGLLAVVPIDLCEEETGHICGAWFSVLPELQTEDKQYVILNNHYDTSSIPCDECGARMIDYCAYETCNGYQVCDGCYPGCEACDTCDGCIECDGCDCEACQACGEKINTYSLDDDGRCDDCSLEEV